MPRGIDHLVLPVNDLVAARAGYERLGFTCTPDAFHPFGTKNFLVQIGHFFLEVLAVHDRALYPDRVENDFSFPRFNDAFLDRNGEGISMLVLDSTDPDADRTQFTEAGLHVHAPFSFGRDAVLPDGTSARVGFDLTFVSDPEMLDCGFFTCRQQHPPELFWKPQYQSHPNTARAISRVVFNGDDWRNHVAFFEGFTGAAADIGDDSARFATSRGDVVIASPKAAGEMLHARTRRSDTLRIAGYEVAVDDLDTLRECLDEGDAGYVVEPDTGRIALERPLHGATIVFAA
ncbi:VOC family protein [Tepidamorphus sp. 3E244]|uniref:VOC family protein n=1 Tax=Tepidamorphus sp. 3E244 TaxID=3385498 RepID=UPI0038FCC8C6